MYRNRHGSWGRSSGGSSSISISGTPATQVTAGQAYSFTPTVTTSATNVSFSIQNKPSWAAFSISTGKLTGTPTSSNVGTYANVVISASNGSATAALTAFTIQVSSAQPAVAPISISGTPSTQVAAGQTYSFTPTVTTSATNVSFSIQNKPSWAAFSISTGQLTGTPTSADAGTYANVVISASNGAATAALPAFTINVSSAGGTAALVWQAPTANTNGTPITDLAGYIIDYGQNASALSQSINIGSATTTSYTVNNLSAGTWYFAVMAYTSDGSQSALSNVVSAAIQ